MHPLSLEVVPDPGNWGGGLWALLGYCYVMNDLCLHHGDGTYTILCLFRPSA
jgi:hypothetical protein